MCPCGPAPGGQASAEGPKECPASLTCPITQECMKDPVMAADGFTYDRHAIVHWLTMRGARDLLRQRL